ncbi:hypothetical protein RBB50_005480 [Rhinocladiella similis]
MAPRDDKPEIKFHDAPGMPEPGFYSHAVSLNQASRLVFTSGIIAQRPDGSFPDSLEEQIKGVYDNLKEVLKKSGATPRDVVKITWYPVNWSLDQGEGLIKSFLDFITDDYGTTYRPITTLVPVTKLAMPDAKIEIEVVAAIGGHASPYAGPLTKAFERPVPPFKVDVVVVGGGFSGVQAAWDVQKAGLSCVLLEAKHRIGGRSRSQKLQSGPGIIELGATWINKTTQPKVYATAKRLSLDIVEQYTTGDEIWQLGDGTVIRTNPDSSEVDLAKKFNADLYQAIEPDLEKVDIHKVEDFPGNLDMSMETWAQTKGLTDPVLAKPAVKFFTSAVVGRDPEEVGMHYFLDYIKSGGGFISIATEGEAGAQSLKIKQGTSAIATGLVDEMTPGSVFVNSPVDSIHQNADGALVQTATGNQMFCRKVIVAIPTNTYDKVNFSPPLPRDKRALVSRTKPGVYAKMILTYTRAWWKDIGLVGKFSSFKGPICFSWDISDDSKGQYSLATFIAGEIAARWARLNEFQRVEAVLDHLAELVGPAHAQLAQDVLEVNYINWSAEEYLGGAPTSTIGPGLLSRYGCALRQPFKHVHFAGGETAFEWKGYLEGALRAGSRAADEVIEWAKKENVIQTVPANL